MSAAVSSAFLDEAIKAKRALDEWERMTLEERAEVHTRFDKGLQRSHWMQAKEATRLYVEAMKSDGRRLLDDDGAPTRRAKVLKLPPRLSPIAQVDCIKLMISNERNKNGTGAGIIAHRTCKVFAALMHHIEWTTGMSVPTSRERLMDPEECGYTSDSTITLALDELVTAGVCRRVGARNGVQVEMLFRTVGELAVILTKWRESPLRKKREFEAAERARKVRQRLIPRPSIPPQSHVGSDSPPTRIDPRDCAAPQRSLSSHLPTRLDLEGDRDRSPGEVTQRAEPAEAFTAAPGTSDTRDRAANAPSAPPALVRCPPPPAPPRASTPPAGRARDGSHGGRESTRQARPPERLGASIRKNGERRDEKIADAFKPPSRATAPPVSVFEPPGVVGDASKPFQDALWRALAAIDRRGPS